MIPDTGNEEIIEKMKTIDHELVEMDEKLLDEDQIQKLIDDVSASGEVEVRIINVHQRQKNLFRNQS